MSPDDRSDHARAHQRNPSRFARCPSTNMPYSTYFPTLLKLFHFFPLHAPITLWVLQAPHGKHAIESSFNLNGTSHDFISIRSLSNPLCLGLELRFSFFSSFLGCYRIWVVESMMLRQVRLVYHGNRFSDRSHLQPRIDLDRPSRFLPTPRSTVVSPLLQSRYTKRDPK